MGPKKIDKSARLSAEDRKRVILDAALPLFARQGYRRTTTAAIAGAAGVTEPILYRHFESKLDLFHVLIREISGKTMVEWESMTRELTDPMEKLVVIARSFPVMGRRSEDDFRIMLAGLTEFDDGKTQKLMRDHYERYAGFLADILSELEPFKKSGLDPTHTAFHLCHLAVGFALMDPIKIPATQGDAYVQHAIRFLGGALG